MPEEFSGGRPSGRRIERDLAASRGPARPLRRPLCGHPGRPSGDLPGALPLERPSLARRWEQLAGKRVGLCVSDPFAFIPAVAALDRLDAHVFLAGRRSEEETLAAVASASGGTLGSATRTSSRGRSTGEPAGSASSPARRQGTRHDPDVRHERSLEGGEPHVGDARGVRPAGGPVRRNAVALRLSAELLCRSPDVSSGVPHQRDPRHPCDARSAGDRPRHGARGRSVRVGHADVLAVAARVCPEGEAPGLSSPSDHARGRDRDAGRARRPAPGVSGGARRARLRSHGDGPAVLGHRRPGGLSRSGSSRSRRGRASRCGSSTASSRPAARARRCSDTTASPRCATRPRDGFRPAISSRFRATASSSEAATAM